MIHQVYIIAVITLVVSAGVWGGLMYLFSGYQKRYFWLLLPGLPLCMIANFYLKQPLTIIVGQAAHIQPYLGMSGPVWFLAFKVLITPLVEEPTKVLPLLLRPARKMVTSRASALWVGFALGVSFGLGEAAFRAYAVAQNPVYDSLPWYAYTGYFSERLFTCFAHGVLTAVLVTGIQRGSWFIIYGVFAAMGLHLFLNTPAVLYSFQWISLELYNFLFLIPFVLLCVIFEHMRRAAREPKDELSSREVVYLSR